MDVTTISGINSMSIYIYNNTKYFFFGDIHGDNLNNCDNKYHCDYFDYTFSKTISYGSNCTTIGPLLHDWLKYNKKHGIETHFYLEKSFNTDINDVFLALINRRKLNYYETMSTIFPDKMSWMELVKYLNIGEPIDIRFYNNERVSPFHLQFLYGIDNDKQLYNFIKIMLINYKFILQSLLTTYDDSLFNFIYSKISGNFKVMYGKQIELMNLMVNNNKKHIIGKTLSDLSLINPKMTQNIIEFIMLLAEVHMENILSDKDLDYYVAVFSVLASYTMDAYVLAKMFLDKNDKINEIIVYAGAAHCEVYNLFFQNYLNVVPIYESPIINDQKCITIEQLPLYLDVNKYRNA